MSSESQLAIVDNLVPSTMDGALSFSAQMAKANLIPAHLKGSPSDCLRVVLQAARWQMDPFAVADKTSVISGKLMYEGQLVSAVVNSRGKLSKKLTYAFDGEGDKRKLTVAGTIQGETEARTIELEASLAKKINKNGQMQTNPDQQMCYIGARLWARRHTPELMLGVYTPDEVSEEDPLNVTPPSDAPVAERTDPAKLRRGRQGASAAKEQAIDIPATTTAETPAAAPAAEPAKVAEPAAVAPVEAAVEATKPEAPKVRTKVEENEVITVNVRLKSAKYENFNAPDKAPMHGCLAEVQGEFLGSIYDLGGGVEGGTLKPVWQSKGPLLVTVKGRKSGRGVIPIVQKVELAPAPDAAAEEPLGLN